jgi:hypothetical protein
MDSSYHTRRPLDEADQAPQQGLTADAAATQESRSFLQTQPISPYPAPRAIVDQAVQPGQFQSSSISPVPAPSAHRATDTMSPLSAKASKYPTEHLPTAQEKTASSYYDPSHGSNEPRSSVWSNSQAAVRQVRSPSGHGDLASIPSRLTPYQHHDAFAYPTGSTASTFQNGDPASPLALNVHNVNSPSQQPFLHRSSVSHSPNIPSTFGVGTSVFNPEPAASPSVSCPDDVCAGLTSDREQTEARMSCRLRASCPAKNLRPHWLMTIHRRHQAWTDQP